MSIFDTIPIDVEQVRQICHDHWDVELTDCLRASRNHTFLARKGTNERFVLRVIPDLKNQRFKATELEVALLQYLHKNELPVCRAIPSFRTHSAIIQSGSLILCLFTFAKGEPLVFTDWTWMTRREIVVGLGHWFARLHMLTRRFAREQPALAAQARHWSTLHDGLLAEIPVDEHDAATMSDPAFFGIIHGDGNPSNYYWDTDVGMPCMFDWDEIQQSWFVYDLAGPIWTVVMLELGGSPIDHSKVEQADSELYTAWLLEGYESDGDRLKVDRSALQRMVKIRREACRRFCRRALAELAPDHHLIQFCKVMINVLDRQEQYSYLLIKTQNTH
jgi:Ser/Thr protein kinase RdoA (MazF antagonist)